MGSSAAAVVAAATAAVEEGVSCCAAGEAAACAAVELVLAAAIALEGFPSAEGSWPCTPGCLGLGAELSLLLGLLCCPSGDKEGSRGCCTAAAAVLGSPWPPALLLPLPPVTNEGLTSLLLLAGSCCCWGSGPACCGAACCATVLAEPCCPAAVGVLLALVSLLLSGMRLLLADRDRCRIVDAGSDRDSMILAACSATALSSERYISSRVGTTPHFRRSSWCCLCCARTASSCRMRLAVLRWPCCSWLTSSLKPPAVCNTWGKGHNLSATECVLRLLTEGCQNVHEAGTGQSEHFALEACSLSCRSDAWHAVVGVLHSAWLQ